MKMATFSLQILPDSPAIPSQQCFMGKALVSSLGIKLGHSVMISTTNGRFLCQAWPRNDNIEGHLQFSRVAFAMDAIPTTSLFEAHACETIRKEDINLFSCDNVKWIKLTIVLDDYAKVKTLRNNLQKSDLQLHVRNVLHEHCLKENFCIASHKLPLGQLYGVSYIVINSLPLGTESGCLKPSTKITIDNVISRERFEQKHFSKSPIIVLGGFDSHAAVLSEFVKMPYEKRLELADLGTQAPRGCLIHGAPGTGKSSLVRHVATSCQAFLMTVLGSEVLGARPGETEASLKKLFAKASAMSEEGPCVLFIDEIDVLAPKSSKGSGSTMASRVVSHLASLLDSMDGYFVVIAATNCISALDNRLRRQGRLEKEMILGIPTLAQRQGILQCLTAGLDLSSDVDIQELALATPGYVPADLMSLVQRAAHAKHTHTVGGSDFLAALHQIVPSTQRGSDLLVHSRPVQWADIGGLDDVKRQIQQAVEWPLKHPQAFARLGIAAPKGLLLTGPPGCAKTLLVRAAATACHVTFLAISGAQLYSPYVGDSERKIAEVFQQARAGAPSILFIDEIDCIVGNRGENSKAAGVQERVLSTLLNEMDGIGTRVSDVQQHREVEEGGQQMKEPTQTNQQEKEKYASADNSGVLLVAATNRPDMLDDALLRPGRIDTIIKVPRPDTQTRLKILEVHTRNMPLRDVDLQQVAEETENFSGADLENLCREAALLALSEEGVEKALEVMQHHMDHMLTRYKPSTVCSV